MTIAPELEGSIVALLQQNLSLTCFTISCNVSSRALLRMTTEALNLQILGVGFEISACTAKQLLERLPESIKSVTLWIKSDGENDDPADKLEDKGLIELKSHYALQILDIKWGWSTRQEYILLPFLNTCKRLRSFDGLTPMCFMNERIRSALARFGIEMKELNGVTLPNMRNSSDQEIAAAILLSSQWQYIHMYWFHHAGRLTSAALLDRCENVRVLNITGSNLISSTDICSLLGKCKHLETFSTIDSMYPGTDRNPVISSADFVELNWASRSLSEFSCNIIVPRGSSQGYENNSYVDLTEATRAIQRQVYRKLAEQTGLRTLNLGQIPAGISEAWYQESCLEMTLESGLDELVLKELRTLDVSFMDHALGVRELEWLAGHWPGLTMVIGMFGTWRRPVPGAREWLRAHKPEWIVDKDLNFATRLNDDDE
ncbi:hypothetical protein BGZ81_004543 [Podila clonocystis]|nr:hypothetical protein BGZ81_004543 [Podila clonocystis]